MSTKPPLQMRKMVSWFHPKELSRAGLRAVLASLFGSYSDKRELQAAFDQPPFRHQPGEEVWIDFVADLGDGFDSTYAVARLMAEETLELSHGDKKHSTHRGSLLVMGGDEVYPVATPHEYKHRFRKPYEAALPAGNTATEERLFAIPGNHDWYDGLTSFTRLFCQKRSVGRRQTEQKRSYWAVKLPHDLWVWGIDVQLDDYIDDPQLDYFKEIAKNGMARGSRIILVTAQPTWVYVGLGKEAAHDRLSYFERAVIQAHHHEMVLVLSGDLHAYAHHAEKNGRRWIMWGGGGASLYPTHHLPESIELTVGQETRHLERQCVYPDGSRSRRLACGSVLFPFFNPAFSAMLGAIYLVFAWFAQSASIEGRAFLEELQNTAPTWSGIVANASNGWLILVERPALAIAIIALTFVLYTWADFRNPVAKAVAGLVHTASHLLLFVASAWLFAWINLGLFGLTGHSFLQVLLFTIEMLLVGGLAGGLVVGLYVFVANLMGAHDETVLVCQRIPDHKGFLRLHLDDKGSLTAYPIGLDKVPRTWREVVGSDPDRPRMDPAAGKIEDYGKLIEEPFSVAPPIARSSPPVSG